MASSKSKAASKKSATSRSRSAARKTSTVQTARTAGDNEPGASKVNQQASDEAIARSADPAVVGTSKEDRDVLLGDALKDVLNADPQDPVTSFNNLPKSEGGLPADEIARLRALRDQVSGSSALGQPGQGGHGVGTASTTIQGPLSEEEAKKDHEAYVKRFKNAS